MFPALCLWTSLAQPVVANDENTTARTAALAVGLSAFVVPDAGLSIVEQRKFPEQTRVGHHQYSDEIKRTV